MCAEVCPASLLPQQLFWYSMAEDFEKLEAHSIADCIECGACSYVCPSNIPLVQHYRASKGAIRQNAIDKEKSDRSRARFEFRQVRIEKAEREKEAKRQARKLAAEAAKKKQAEKQASGENTAGSPDKADVVAKAIAAVKKQDLSPEETLAKLERALNSASSRLKKTLERADAAESDKKDAILARVKDAELKVRDAEQKLADFKAKDTSATPATQSAATKPVEATDDVASAAIAKAKAKAAELASMSPEEKKQQQLVSLSARVEKARARLAKAEEENDENVEAFRTGYEKTLAKHQQLSDELSASQENG
jgi:electron transport complex protein RnfC